MTILKLSLFVIITFILFLLPANVSATVGLPYGSGYYTNLCGSADALSYDNGAGDCRFGHCDTVNGYCDNAGLVGSPASVVRFVCNGQHDECKGVDVIREDWGARQEITFPDPGCDKTVQIDVFDKYCYSNNQWDCFGEPPSGNLKGFMVWYSGACTTPPPPPPTPAPGGPRIQNLKIGNDSDSQTIFGGLWKLTGLSLQDSGSNWLNPLKIQLTVKPGTSSKIKAYYFAFYDKSIQQPTEGNFLNSIKSTLTDSKKGVLLAYGYPDEIVGSGGSSTKRFYVYDATANPQWQDISTRYNVNATTLYYQTQSKPNITTETTGSDYTVAWTVTFKPPFGSRSLYTGALVKDENNLTHYYPELEPLNF